MSNSALFMKKGKSKDLKKTYLRKPNNGMIKQISKIGLLIEKKFYDWR